MLDCVSGPQQTPTLLIELVSHPYFHSIVFFVSFKVHHQGGRRRAYSYPGFLSQIDHVIGIGCDIVYHLPTRLYTIWPKVLQTQYKVITDIS
jgi:hypothetical protein